ncbi:MAG: glycosyltransferase family 4 protein [Candidatus Aenigmarchaeota archaeon]|nr:glycosyltransferase family 4 protein [Candidatus Aenigmarchaeota archaeon]
MKIAFVIPAYYPAVIGESLYAQELAKYLIKKGHEVNVYTHISGNLKESEIADNVKITRVKIKEIFDGSFYFSSDYIKSILKEKFDIIHSHHYGYFPATAGFIAAKLTKTPHVFGTYYHPPVYGRLRWLQFMAYHFTQGLPILRFSDSVLPHTLYEKKMLLKIGGKEDNMKILPNIVDTNTFMPGHDKTKTILFVGNFIYEKGAHIAFDIASQLLEQRKDIRFVFIGNAYEPKLMPKINQLSKSKNVLFLKNLRKSELVRWYQKASVFLLPSKYEAFSRGIAEAESCSIPVVSTRVGAIPEVVKDGKSGFLVDYGEWDEMRQHIEYLLDNLSEAKKMGKRGREHIVKNFDTEIVAEKLEKIYKDLV